MERAGKKLNIDISASGGTAQTREINGRGSTREKRTKTEYGYKRRCGGKDGRGVQEKTAAARRGAEAVGRQALAERAASEAKFVLIAERKTQEEA